MSKKRCAYKKTTTSKRKKSSARKASKKAAKRARKKYREPGYYRRRGSGLLVPESTDGQSQLVPASKLEKGVADAKDRMKDIIYDIASTLDDEFELRDVEFQASFSADGKFLGFGVGGATSITLRVQGARVTPHNHPNDTSG